jgi:hypothetical protein
MTFCFFMAAVRFVNRADAVGFGLFVLDALADAASAAAVEGLAGLARANYY